MATILIVSPMGCRSIEPLLEEETYESLCDQAQAKRNEDLLYGAVFLMDRAVRMDPSRAEAYLIRGRARQALGHVHTAIEDLTLYIDRAPLDPKGYYYRGLVYAQERWFEKGRADMTRVIELDPRHIRALMERGELNLELADYGDAVADFNRTLEFDPEQPKAFVRRMQARLRSSAAKRSLAPPADLKAELQSLDRLVDANSTDPAWFYSRGWVRWSMAVLDGDRAIEHLTSALEDFRKSTSLADNPQVDELGKRVEQDLEELRPTKF